MPPPLLRASESAYTLAVALGPCAPLAHTTTPNHLWPTLLL